MDFNRFSIVWYKWQGKRTEVRAMTLVATILYSRGHCFLTPPDNQHNGKANPNPHCTTTSKCRHSFFFLFPSLSFVFLFYFLFLSFFLIFFFEGFVVRSKDVFSSSSLQPSRSRRRDEEISKTKEDGWRIKLSVGVFYQCLCLSNSVSLCLDSSFDPRGTVE